MRRVYFDRTVLHTAITGHGDGADAEKIEAIYEACEDPCQRWCVCVCGWVCACTLSGERESKKEKSERAFCARACARFCMLHHHTDTRFRVQAWAHLLQNLRGRQTTTKP